MTRSSATALATILLFATIPAAAECTPVFSDVLNPGLSNEFYGSQIDVSGTTLVVAAGFADSAYVYRWDGAQWVESQILTGGQPGGEFGASVAVDGDWILVGAPRTKGQGHGKESGSVHFFRFDGAQWNATQVLFASDGDQFDHFGNDVALGGGVAIVGAVEDEQTGPEGGSAYVLRFDGSEWNEEQKLLAFDGKRQDHYGRDVEIAPDLNQVFVASSNVTGIALGAVYVYEHDGDSWEFETKLVPNDPQQGFGDAMAVEGSVAVIGAQGSDTQAQDSGAAFVFRHDGAAWQREQRLLASDGGESDRFGWSVAIQGNLIAVGAHNDADQAFNAGSAYVFEHNGTKWREAAKLYSSGGEENGHFGSAVAMAQGTLVVGQEGNDMAEVFDISSCQP